ncbi:MAG: amidase [Myxococcales bacterium]|nr:amidase [Myxococcales bacterium]
MALFKMLRSELRIDELGALPNRLRGPVPLDNRPLAAADPRAWEDERLSAPAAPWSLTAERVVDAYRRKAITPTELVTRVLAAARAFEARRPSLGPFCDYADEGALREAAAATARWQRGAPATDLDGLPYAVKEETAVCGLPLRAGAAFLPTTPCEKDATIVDRIHARGGVVVGLTSMTEFGMTPTGVNPKRLMPRNPHAVDRLAGGSSTGSAVAVATGLVPFALGGDGGGSIRIPASLTGIFGIKPTWGRLSRAGDFFGGTVAHVGPLASSTLDLARVLEMASGHDPADPETAWAPERTPGSFYRALGRGVRGVRIGVVDTEWADATDPVSRAGREALRALEAEGAKLVPLRSELLQYAAAIGYVTISVEARAGLRAYWEENRDEMTEDLQVSFASLDAIGAVEYLETTRLRVGLRHEARALFGEVDVLALPTVRGVAAPVSDDDMATGFLDAKVIDDLCRFTFLANLTGLPAASAPVGRDVSGLPIGLQIVGDAWDEASVLAVVAHLERIGAARVERPEGSVDLLDGV